MEIKIFTPCASKQVEVPNELRFHNLEKQNIESLFDDWDNRKNNTIVDEVKVMDIYKGGYWNTIKSIYNTQSQNIYIVGAGYGIVSINDYIKPYSAAFSEWFEDDVKLRFNDDSTYKDWWNLYNTKKQISISNYWNPNDIFIISTNQSYTLALEDDISNIIHHPNVYFISPNSISKKESIIKHKLPFSGLLQQILGGNRRMINAITISHLINKLNEFDYDRNKVFEYFSTLVSQCKSIPFNYKYQKTNDEHILQLINEFGRDKTPYKLRKLIEGRGYSISEPRILKIMNS